MVWMHCNTIIANFSVVIAQHVFIHVVRLTVVVVCSDSPACCRSSDHILTNQHTHTRSLRTYNKPRQMTTRITSYHETTRDISLSISNKKNELKLEVVCVYTYNPLKPQTVIQSQGDDTYVCFFLDML